MKILGAFAVVAALSPAHREADDLEDYRGLFWCRPLLGGIFTITLLSLAGMPATAGFIGKLYVIAAGASGARWFLVIVLIVGSAIGLFYYLRIIAVMFSDARHQLPVSRRLSATEGVVLVTVAAVIVCLGIYPAPILSMIAGK